MAMLSHPRIGILGSLIKGLPDLWPRHNDETAFGHFFDRTKNNLVIYITNAMPGALFTTAKLLFLPEAHYSHFPFTNRRIPKGLPAFSASGKNSSGISW